VSIMPKHRNLVPSTLNKIVLGILVDQMQDLYTNKLVYLFILGCSLTQDRTFQVSLDHSGSVSDCLRYIQYDFSASSITLKLCRPGCPGTDAASCKAGKKISFHIFPKDDGIGQMKPRIS